MLMPARNRMTLARPSRSDRDPIEKDATSPAMWNPAVMKAAIPAALSPSAP